MGNEDFPCLYLSKTSVISSVHERVCEWSQALISNHLNVQVMSPVILPLTPCLPGHLDLLLYHIGLEPLPYHCMTDRSYHIMSTYLITWLLVQAVPTHTKGTKCVTKAFYPYDSICLCDGEEIQDPRKERQLHIKVARIVSSPPKSYSPCSLLNRCPAFPSQGWTPWYMASDWAIAWKIFWKSNLVASNEPPGLQSAYNMAPLSHDEHNTLS